MSKVDPELFLTKKEADRLNWYQKKTRTFKWGRTKPVSWKRMASNRRLAKVWAEFDADDAERG